MSRFTNRFILLAAWRHFGIIDDVSLLQLDRENRTVRSDRTDQTWQLPDDWDLS